MRNDEHFIKWHRWIENYGSTYYLKVVTNFPNQPHGWPYWQSNGFSKLLDFWDRGHYTGSGSQLDADATGSDKIGLAEWSNGNFLGEDATYADFFSTSSKQYFPLPSLLNTDQPQLTADITGTVDTITLRNLQQGNRQYLKKTGAGIQITHHSAFTYLAAKNFPKLAARTMRVGVTINDTNVLQEYHANFIPKAIEYSAGILDYFFRGTMSVTVGGYDAGSSQYTNVIVNNSGQDFSGGTFYVFADDTNGNRTLVGQTNLSGTLPAGANTNMLFTGPSPLTNRLLVVYQGTIGVSSGTNAADPVDAGTAIAVQMLLTNGPIAWWPADGNAVDVIGGHNGTMENVTFTPGQIGQAFAFDPETYGPVRIQVPDDPAFILTNALSIEGWVRPRGQGTLIFFRGDTRSGYDPYVLATDSSSNVVFQICADDGTTAAVSTPLGYGVWSHVAATFDSGLMSLYVNAQLKAQTTTSLRPIANLVSTDEPGVAIGNTYADDDLNEPFYGDIDQISLYSRALGTNEIQAIYNAGLGGTNYY